MSKVLVTESYLSAIASAIRLKNGKSSTYRPSQMASAIQSIKSAGALSIISKTITSNGSYLPSHYSADAFSYIKVSVPSGGGGSAVLVSKTITSNGEYDPFDDNADAYSYVTVSVPTGSTPVLVSKSISVNGIYNPVDDDADAYSGVVVNVPNTYTAGDEGKVVASGSLSSQGAFSVSANSVYDTTFYSQVTVSVPSGGGSAVLVSKTLSSNGTYNASADFADGYSQVIVNVPTSGGYGFDYETSAVIDNSGVIGFANVVMSLPIFVTSATEVTE